jgi:hypothetical protein
MTEIMKMIKGNPEMMKGMMADMMNNPEMMKRMMQGNDEKNDADNPEMMKGMMRHDGKAEK